MWSWMDSDDILQVNTSSDLSRTVNQSLGKQMKLWRTCVYIGKATEFRLGVELEGAAECKFRHELNKCAYCCLLRHIGIYCNL